MKLLRGREFVSDILSEKIRVLLMDDEEIVRTVADKMLQHLGYAVALTRDGEEVVSVYREAKESGRPFDIVILDLTVPRGVDGKEAIARLRAYDPDVRAIISSGYPNDPAVADYREHGFVGVMNKPYELRQMEAALAEVLNPRRGAR